MIYKKIEIDVNLGNCIRHLEIDNEVEINEYNNLLEKINKATNYYLKELSKRGSIDDAAVKMYNILEGNINEDI